MCMFCLFCLACGPWGCKPMLHLCPCGDTGLKPVSFKGTGEQSVVNFVFPLMPEVEDWLIPAEENLASE